jgi:outer membrane protein
MVLAMVLAAVAGCTPSSERDSSQAAAEVLKAINGTAPAVVTPTDGTSRPAAAGSVAASPSTGVTKPAATASASAVTGTQAATVSPVTPAVGPIRLTLAEFLKRTLAGNSDIQIAGYGPPQSREDITMAESIFDPIIFGSTSAGRLKRPTQSELDTGATSKSSLIQQTWSFQGGVRDKLPTGGTFAIYQSSDYMDTNSVFTVPNPQYSTRLTFEYSQPLLRSGGVGYTTAPIRVATLNAEISVQDFRKQVTDTIATAISSYWQLVFDMEAARVSQVSLDLAADVLRREKAHLALGVSSAVDVNRAEAAVSLRQAEVVRAKNQVRDDIDRLKLLMNATDIPLTGDTEIVPLDSPRYYVADINRSEAIATALEHRPELLRGRRAVDIQRIRVDVAAQDRLPELNATLRYVLNGLGRAFHQGIEQQSFTDLNTWSVGLEFEFPIDNRAANAAHRRRQLEYQQSVKDLDRLSSQATQEVIATARAVMQARQEVEANLEAAQAASRQVQGEQRRFDLGQTTSDELLRAQETQAQAQRDYLKALLNFNLGLISLARAEGVMLESQGIEIFSFESATVGAQPLGLRQTEGGGPTTPPGVRLTPVNLDRAATPATGQEKR